MVLKRFDSLIRQILLCGSEVWTPYRGYYFSTWDKTEVERVHLQFLKRLCGVLNISTRNITVIVNWEDAQNETLNFINHERDVQKRL